MKFGKGSKLNNGSNPSNLNKNSNDIHFIGVLYLILTMTLLSLYHHTIHPVIVW